MTTRERLRDEQLGLPPILRDIREQLGRLSGVLAVGVGLKVRAGRVTEELAWTVDVATKLPRERVRREQRIPSEIAGVPTDVRQKLVWGSTADLLDEGDDEKYALLEGGISVSSDAHSETRGTLGCFARLKADATAIVLLTNHHILYDDPAKRGPGELVGQPRVSCTRCCRTGVIARTLDGVRGPLADAAIAKLNGKRPWTQLLVGLGRDTNGRNEDMITGSAPVQTIAGAIQTSVLCGERVRKLGRTTGVTAGEVVALDGLINKPDPFTQRVVVFDHQVMIMPIKGKPDDFGRQDFAREGDSGAVVVNARNEVVGLLHTAGPLSQADLPQHGGCPGVTIPASAGLFGGMSQIQSVLDALQIEIIPSTPARSVPAVALLPGMGIVPRPMNTEDLARSEVLDEIVAELDRSPLGKALIGLYERHGPELRVLLDQDRRCKIAWHRNHGPAFIAQLLRGMRSTEQPIPHSIEGVAIEEALQRVASVFIERGSAELKRAAHPHLPRVGELLAGSSTVRELLERVRVATSA